MKKECVILKDLNHNPIMILEIKTFTNSQTYLEFEKLCGKNALDLTIELAAKQERINQLEHRIKKTELELAFNRGDLTEEEYENEISRL